jgi:hypothetical protein
MRLVGFWGLRLPMGWLFGLHMGWGAKGFWVVRLSTQHNVCYAGDDAPGGQPGPFEHDGGLVGPTGVTFRSCGMCDPLWGSSSSSSSSSNYGRAHCCFVRAACNQLQVMGTHIGPWRA